MLVMVADSSSLTVVGASPVGNQQLRCVGLRYQAATRVDQGAGHQRFMSFYVQPCLVAYILMVIIRNNEWLDQGTTGSTIGCQ